VARGTWTLGCVTTTAAGSLVITNILGVGLGAGLAGTMSGSAWALRSIAATIAGRLVIANILDVGLRAIGAGTSSWGTGTFICI